MIKYSLVDTNIWHHAYVKPSKKELLPLYQKAQEFVRDILTNESVIVSVTHYQIAEVMELLRKHRLPAEVRKTIFENFKSTKFLKRAIDLNMLELCFQKSLASGIHIYDYLVVFPLKDIVDEIFSADDHFQHQDFKEIAKVTNPLHPWILREGRLPTTTSSDNNGNTSMDK